MSKPAYRLKSKGAGLARARLQRRPQDFNVAAEIVSVVVETLA